MTGWTQLDSVVADDMGTVFWTKVAQAGDAGTQVTVPLSGSAKYTLTVAAYSGVDPAARRDRSPEPRTRRHVNRLDPGRHRARRAPGSCRTGPTSPARPRPGPPPPRSAGVSSSAAPTPAASAASWPTRGTVVAAGSYPGITATTNAPSNKATAWSIVLPPAPATASMGVGNVARRRVSERMLARKDHGADRGRSGR